MLQAVASVSNAVLDVPFAADTGSRVHNRKPPKGFSRSTSVRIPKGVCRSVEPWELVPPALDIEAAVS